MLMSKTRHPSRSLARIRVLSFIRMRWKLLLWSSHHVEFKNELWQRDDSLMRLLKRWHVKGEHDGDAMRLVCARCISHRKRLTPRDIIPPTIRWTCIHRFVHTDIYTNGYDFIVSYTFVYRCIQYTVQNTCILDSYYLNWVGCAEYVPFAMFGCSPSDALLGESHSRSQNIQYTKSHEIWAHL